MTTPIGPPVEVDQESLVNDQRARTQHVPRTLSGYTVGVTADRRSEEQIQLLEDRGATCVHGPMLETQALLADSGIASATRLVIDNPPDVTILSTGIGVRGWFSSADALLLGKELRLAVESSEIYARGPKAHGAAVTAGLNLDTCATWPSLDDIIDELQLRSDSGLRVAIQLDGDPDAVAISRLNELEAEVVPIPVYQWTLPTNRSPAEDLIAAVAAHQIDAVTFTARPAVQHFVSIAQELDLFGRVQAAARTNTALLCVGERTATAVEDAGLHVAGFPERPLLGTMVMLLTEQLEKRTTELQLLGHSVVLRGRELSVGDEPVQTLPFRERHLFELLASRPGVVFAKDRLLDRVWQGAAHDEHAVEVAVGRLRKRLGDAGSGIETVRRRGYRMVAA